MERRTIRRALAGAATALILSTAAAFADTVPASDSVIPANQGIVLLPDATPGQVVTRSVDFGLKCGGTTHAEPGATIQLDLDTVSVPLDGAASATSTSIGPVPADWALGGCASPAPTLAANAPSVVTLTMPSTAGDGYEFTVFWSRTGSSGLSGSTAITFRVDVVGNTPPAIHLPSGASAEATSPAGAPVSWTATATDAEDAVPPTPTCLPASGSTFALGITSVSCSVTDGGGLSASGSFLVTVGDTAAPTLVGMPADRSLTTADPTGATLTYTAPTATDLVDPSPQVECSPASGTHVELGSTVVTCTARDATGNHAEASFAVNVTLAAPTVAWTALWGEPLATDGSAFVANAGRTVPVKVRLFADGVERTHGSAILTVATCAGSPAGSLTMTWSGGRWNGSVDTGSLGGPGCYRVSAQLDGNLAGSFQFTLRGSEPTVNSSGPKGKSKP
jgi:HYR domain-containing protein